MRFIPTLLLLSALAATPLAADEGMWPYNRLPLARLAAEHDFKPEPAFLERLQRASVRLNNGGSGSFVTHRGLLMTNHHVASDCIGKLSSADKDYIADGFYASTQSRELKCPDLELNVLMEIEEVTERVNRNVAPDATDAERLEAQKAEQAHIERDCRDSTLLRCDVVNLHHGGIFDLYKYKRYTDVRLVFAPEFQLAYFGGDPDNFTYPRYCLDVSFLRAYENGRPIESPAFLPIARQGVAEQELVLVSGHPGATKRLLTESQLQYERDRRIPFVLRWLRSMADALNAYGRGGGDAERLARDEIFSLNNSIKAYTGQLAGLRDADLFAAKSKQEQELRAKIAADPALAENFGDAWERIASAQRAKIGLYDEYRLVDSLGFYSRYFTIAKHLYRLSAELPKPNDERLPEYRETRIESLEQQLYSAAPFYPELEIVKLSQSLSFLKDWLGPRHPLVEKQLGSGRTEDLARRLVEGSRLADLEFRKQLGADDAKAAATSDDPFLELVRATDEQARALRKRYEDEVEAVETAQGARIAQARFAVFGTGVYPDATFTLRLAVGLVRAYLEHGKRVDAFTSIGGLFERATGEQPYVLPKKILAAKTRLDPDVHLNLVSTNDITGGNSGSPLINLRGEVVGLIFDGNIQSLSNDFLYSERQARAVSVDARGIVEMLRDGYRAERLISELAAAQKLAQTK